MAKAKANKAEVATEPERLEDIAAVEDETPLSAPEVPLEDSRKDESTLLATDTLLVHDDGTIEKIPAG